MESEEAREHEYAQENNKVCLGLLDSKATQLPVRLFLQVLPDLQPTLSPPRWDDLSSCILVEVNQGNG